MTPSVAGGVVPWARSTRDLPPALPIWTRPRACSPRAADDGNKDMTLLATQRLFWHCGAHTDKPKQIGVWTPIAPNPCCQSRFLFCGTWCREATVSPLALPGGRGGEHSRWGERACDRSSGRRLGRKPPRAVDFRADDDSRVDFRADVTAGPAAGPRQPRRGLDAHERQQLAQPLSARDDGASRSVRRRALLTPEVNPGSRYRRSGST